MTPTSLKECTRKDLEALAKEKGVSGWYAMRKEELIRALARKTRPARPSRPKAKPASRSNGSRRGASVAKRKVTAEVSKRVEAAGSNGARRRVASETPRKRVPTKSAKVLTRIRLVHEQREQLRDLSCAGPMKKAGNRNGHNGHARRDRVVLMVRDPFWLHAFWEIGRRSVERAQAAMSEHWHTAKPVLRLIEVDAGATTSSAERVVREIEVHGGVNNWYIDVYDPPQSHRVDLGYLAANGRFHSLARSNAVTTPRPGNLDAVDQNWQAVAQDYENVYAMSGGYNVERSSGDLRELFEERLRRPMGSPLVSRSGLAGRGRSAEFLFHVDAELIIYGQTRPEAQVTLAGQPIKLRPDGSFTVRRSLPDRRQVLPVVAGSGDGLEERTIILAVERNTKVMEPVTRDTAVC